MGRFHQVSITRKPYSIFVCYVGFTDSHPSRTGFSRTEPSAISCVTRDCAILSVTDLFVAIQVISLAATYGLYFIGSFMHFEPWHMFTSFIRELFRPGDLHELLAHAREL